MLSSNLSEFCRDEERKAPNGYKVDSDSEDDEYEEEESSQINENPSFSRYDSQNTLPQQAIFLAYVDDCLEEIVQETIKKKEETLFIIPDLENFKSQLIKDSKKEVTVNKSQSQLVQKRQVSNRAYENIQSQMNVSNYSAVLNTQAQTQQIQPNLNQPNTPRPSLDVSRLREGKFVDFTAIINNPGKKPVPRSRPDGTSYSTRNVYLEDCNGKTILLKLWDEMATNFSFEMGAFVSFTNIGVKTFNYQNELATTKNTKMTLIR